MAAESFFINLIIDKNHKNHVLESISKTSERDHKNHYTYKKHLNIMYNNENDILTLEGSFISFANSIIVMFNLCCIVIEKKEDLKIKVFNMEIEFKNQSLESFLSIVFAEYKDKMIDFNEKFGTFNILPGEKFYKFMRKNRNNFSNKLD